MPDLTRDGAKGGVGTIMQAKFSANDCALKSTEDRSKRCCGTEKNAEKR
jgi:hypothetical protein